MSLSTVTFDLLRNYFWSLPGHPQAHGRVCVCVWCVPLPLPSVMQRTPRQQPVTVPAFCPQRYSLGCPRIGQSCPWETPPPSHPLSSSHLYCAAPLVYIFKKHYPHFFLLPTIPAKVSNYLWSLGQGGGPVIMTASSEAASSREVTFISQWGWWSCFSYQVAVFFCSSQRIHQETTYNLICIVFIYKWKDKTLQLSTCLYGVEIPQPCA